MVIGILEEKVPFADIESQIRENQKKVDFDVKEFTIEYYVDKFKKGDFFVPEYQRDFVWDKKRQSRFIESIVLGLPIPFIFTADVYERDDKDDESREGNLEIVDGSQRIRTLASFIKNELQLADLEILDKLNGLYFKDFSPARQKRFLNSTIRMILISDKSDADVRFMMFERINTGGDVLAAMEKRKGIDSGKFIDFIYDECAKNPLFVKLTRFTEKMKKRGEAEELILRFFAYSEKYTEFKYSVIEFLDDYVKEKNKNFDKEAMSDKFQKMLEFVEKHFPYGFLRKSGARKTPRIRFEAISVGVWLALEENPELQPPPTQNWLESEDFIKEISGGNSVNAPATVRSRIHFVRDQLLGRK